MLAALLVITGEAVEVTGFQLQIELHAPDDLGLELEVSAQGFVLPSKLQDATFKLGLHTQQCLGLLVDLLGKGGVLFAQLGGDSALSLQAGELGTQLGLALIAQAQLLIEILVLALQIFQLNFVGRRLFLKAQDFGPQFRLGLVTVGQFVGESGVLTMQLLQLFVVSRGRRLQAGNFGTQFGGQLIPLGQGIGKSPVLAMQFIQLFFVDGLRLEFDHLGRERLILLTELGNRLLLGELLGIDAGGRRLCLQFLLQASDLLVLLGHQQLGTLVILLQGQQLSAAGLGPPHRLDRGSGLAAGFVTVGGVQAFLTLVEKPLDALFLLVVASQKVAFNLSPAFVIQTVSDLEALANLRELVANLVLSFSASADQQATPIRLTQTRFSPRKESPPAWGDC